MITASVSIYDNLAGLGSDESLTLETLANSVASISRAASFTTLLDDQSNSSSSTDITRAGSPVEGEKDSIALSPTASPASVLLAKHDSFIQEVKRTLEEEVDDGGYNAECEDEYTIVKPSKPRGIPFRDRAPMLHLTRQSPTPHQAYVGLGLGLLDDNDASRITCIRVNPGLGIHDSPPIRNSPPNARSARRVWDVSPISRIPKSLRPPSPLIISSPQIFQLEEEFTAPGAPLLPSLPTPEGEGSMPMLDMSPLGSGLGLGLGLA